MSVSPPLLSTLTECGRDDLCVGEEVNDGKDEGVKSADVEDGEVVNNQGAEDIVSQEPEVEPLKVLPTPVLPTQSEIDEHQVDHIPYRSWCRHCGEGFGSEDGHPCAGGRK